MWSRTYSFPTRKSPGMSNAAHPLSSLPPYLSFPPMLPGNQSDHQNNQGCGNIWCALCPNRQPASANTPGLDIFLLVRIHCAFHALTHDDLLCSMGPLSHANTFEGKSTLIPTITSVFAGSPTNLLVSIQLSCNTPHVLVDLFFFRGLAFSTQTLS